MTAKPPTTAVRFIIHLELRSYSTRSVSIKPRGPALIHTRLFGLFLFVNHRGSNLLTPGLAGVTTLACDIRTNTPGQPPVQNAIRFIVFSIIAASIYFLSRHGRYIYRCSSANGGIPMADSQVGTARECGRPLSSVTQASSGASGLLAPSVSATLSCHFFFT